MTSISKEMMSRMDLAFFLGGKIEKLEFQILLGVGNLEKTRKLIIDLYDPYMPREIITKELSELKISPKIITPGLALDDLDYEGYFKERLGRVN